ALTETLYFVDIQIAQKVRVGLFETSLDHHTSDEGAVADHHVFERSNRVPFTQDRNRKGAVFATHFLNSFEIALQHGGVEFFLELVRVVGGAVAVVVKPKRTVF
ncbi:MAG: hypothetical protein MJA30_07910, partial [Cytophagales bacterium]|nr:hypothetical protein [Cytophagales bacterium]